MKPITSKPRLEDVVAAERAFVSQQLNREIVWLMNDCLVHFAQFQLAV